MHTKVEPSRQKLDKPQLYESLVEQFASLTEHEHNLVANLANCASLFYTTFKQPQYVEQYPINWFGFYLVDRKKEGQLVLGPFMGNVACTRIPKGKGVCGTCWKKEQTMIVENVHDFEGHIACDSASNSEICVPIRNKNDQFAGLIDVDSIAFSQFDQVDKTYLERIAELIRTNSDWE
jgi:L-methionine (R)-S-oxide reductase